jgi:RNA polymerase sigma-70 factor, ECF subfamily
LDKDSLNALIQSQYGGLLRLLQSRLRSRQLAEDALNQAVVTTLEHAQAGRIADLSKVGGYIFRVALNQMRNYRRQIMERPERRADVSLADSLQSDPFAETDSGCSWYARAVVAALPTARDREIVKRFYLDEEEKDSICRDLQLSPLHFDKVIFRARHRMRALLEAKGIRKTDVLGILCAA